MEEEIVVTIRIKSAGPCTGYRIETLPEFPSRFLGNTRDVRIAVWSKERGTGNKEDEKDGWWRAMARRARAQRNGAPLLVLNDGQDLEALGILAALESLVAAGEVEAPIVVAVPSNRERLMEYGITGCPDFAGRGARAGAYARFVREELLPIVWKRFGATKAPARTAILGASMGGLSAFDLAWGDPDVFGICGALSGSFWWRGDSTDARAKQASRIAHRLVRDTKRRSRALAAVRFWFQAGTADETEDRDGNGVIDAIQDTTELIDELGKKGWDRERELIYREVAGGRHDQATWAAVFAEFARFAFARQS